MNYKDIKKILSEHYSFEMVKSLLIGRTTPSYKMASLFYRENQIPFEAWLDIKSFIANNSESKKCEQELQGDNECA